MRILILTICILAIFLFGVNSINTNSAVTSQKIVITESESIVNYSTKNSVSEKSNVLSETSLLDISFRQSYSEAEQPESPQYDIRMLMNAEYYEEEVEDKIGRHKGWLGLYRNKDKYSLKPTTIEVKAVHHQLRDDKKSKEKTGKTIVSNVKLPSVFLLKNAKMLTSGDVNTIFYGNEENADSIDRTYRREFDFDNLKYTLFVEDSSTENGGYLTKDSKMVVIQGNRKQIIYKPDFCSDCFWNLDWVGDLDRDGKLDFMLNLTPHYNSTCHMLFLSSQAKRGEIVRGVAELCQQGC